MRIVFLGPPGSGKGTQASRFAAEGMVHISTGNILRKAVADETPVGLRAREFIVAGELVPDEVVSAIVVDRVRQTQGSSGFILDGFPRNLAQAGVLDADLDELELPVEHVVYFEIDEASILVRLTGRRTCRSCGESCHVTFDPPAREGVCDDCGGELYLREDDREETVRNRLRVYENQTASLVEFYEAKKLLCRVDASRRPDEVTEDVRGCLAAV